MIRCTLYFNLFLNIFESSVFLSLAARIWSVVRILLTLVMKCVNSLNWLSEGGCSDSFHSTVLFACPTLYPSSGSIPPRTCVNNLPGLGCLPAAATSEIAESGFWRRRDHTVACARGDASSVAWTSSTTTTVEIP